MKTAMLFLALSLGACRATTPAPVVETVGSLSPSYRSIAVAPVAPTTDLSIAYQAVSDDDEVATAAAPVAVEAPDVAPKAGLVMGSVR